jgi:hypothetical protein
MMEEPSSPVCYLSEAEDRYMGYADASEIAAALNVLLEAERAGTRVALATRRQTTDPELAAFMAGIEKDEAHWCAMLKTRIEALGAQASTACGDFYDKAMAIEDAIERLRFLNRGQSWVVRKIEALRPRVRDDGLHRALTEMAERHLANMAATDAFIEMLAGR